MKYHILAILSNNSHYALLTCSSSQRYRGICDIIRNIGNKRVRIRQELLTLIPTARAVLRLTSSPSLSELPLLSFNASTGTFLEAAITGICFVSHFGLQSVAKSTAYKVIAFITFLF